jgi:hypothetical protein
VISMVQPPLYPPTRAELLDQIKQLRAQGIVSVAEAAATYDEAVQLLNGSVRRARDAGASWDDIARATGMSRQGAQQRWGRRAEK